jgi:hypothetical protein
MAVEAMDEDYVDRGVVTGSIDLRQAKLLDRRGMDSSHGK